MDRRRLLQLALAAGAAGALSGHTPYRQWEVYRKTRLIILTGADDPDALPLAERLAQLLADRVPGSRATAARTRDGVEVIRLIASRQLDVALLAAEQASLAARGAGPFAAAGPVALRTLARIGRHVLVCRDDFPAALASQIAGGLAEAWPGAGAGAPAAGAHLDATPAFHDGALQHHRDRPPASR